MSTIGSRLKEERERLGYNQTDFGAIGGVKKSAQIRYENNRRSPDLTYLAAVAEIGVDAQYVTIGVHSDTTYNQPAALKVKTIEEIDESLKQLSDEQRQEIFSRTQEMLIVNTMKKEVQEMKEKLERLERERK